MPVWLIPRYESGPIQAERIFGVAPSMSQICQHYHRQVLRLEQADSCGPACVGFDCGMLHIYRSLKDADILVVRRGLSTKALCLENVLEQRGLLCHENVLLLQV